MFTQHEQREQKSGLRNSGTVPANLAPEKNQAQVLETTGLRLLNQTETLKRASEIEKVTKLALELLRTSREIQAEKRHNSVVAYFEVCGHLGRAPDYPAYLDFCARNNLDMLAEVDFKDYCSKVGELAAAATTAASS